MFFSTSGYGPEIGRSSPVPGPLPPPAGPTDPLGPLVKAIAEAALMSPDFNNVMFLEAIMRATALPAAVFEQFDRRMFGPVPPVHGWTEREHRMGRVVMCRAVLNRNKRSAKEESPRSSAPVIPATATSLPGSLPCEPEYRRPGTPHKPKLEIENVATDYYRASGTILLSDPPSTAAGAKRKREQTRASHPLPALAPSETPHMDTLSFENLPPLTPYEMADSLDAETGPFVWSTAGMDQIASLITEYEKQPSTAHTFDRENSSELSDIVFSDPELELRRRNRMNGGTQRRRKKRRTWTFEPPRRRKKAKKNFDFEDIVGSEYFPVSKNSLMLHLEVRWAPTWDTLTDLVKLDRGADLKVREFQNSKLSREQLLQLAEERRRDAARDGEKVAAVIGQHGDKFETVWVNSYGPFDGGLVQKSMLERVGYVPGRGKGGMTGDGVISDSEPGLDSSVSSDSSNSDSESLNSGSSDDGSCTDSEGNSLWQVEQFIRGRWDGSTYYAEYSWLPNWMTRDEILLYDDSAGPLIDEFENRARLRQVASEESEFVLGKWTRAQARKAGENPCKVARILRKVSDPGQMDVYYVLWCNSEYPYFVRS